MLELAEREFYAHLCDRKIMFYILHTDLQLILKPVQNHESGK